MKFLCGGERKVLHYILNAAWVDWLFVLLHVKSVLDTFLLFICHKKIKASQHWILVSDMLILVIEFIIIIIIFIYLFIF